MVDTINEYQPDYAVTPGEVLLSELELRGMSQQELSNRTGITTKHINEIINAKASISVETAIKLERATGMPVQYWLNLEANYQEIKARLAERARLEEDLEWLKRIPVAEMAKQGWIEKLKDKSEQLSEVLGFFGIASVSQWAKMWPTLNVAYRQSQSQRVSPEAVSAWLRQGELLAANIACQPYNEACFKNALDDIRGLTTESPESFVPQMTEVCAAAGVAVVFVPALPRTGISGATRWLNKDKAIIQLSLRYKADDHLWFTFFHEAGHILKHGKKELFLEGANGLNERKEKEADEYAQKKLVPPAAMAAFLKSSPRPSASEIVSFAESIGISPGIVVGQLQYCQVIPMNHHNGLKQRFRFA